MKTTILAAVAAATLAGCSGPDPYHPPGARNNTDARAPEPGLRVSNPVDLRSNLPANEWAMRAFSIYGSAAAETCFEALRAEFGSGDDLRANTGGADLRSNDLRSADLRSVDLRSAYLRSVSLRSAELRAVNPGANDLRSNSIDSVALRAQTVRDQALRSAALRGDAVAYRDFIADFMCDCARGGSAEACPVP